VKGIIKKIKLYQDIVVLHTSDTWFLLFIFGVVCLWKRKNRKRITLKRFSKRKKWKFFLSN